MTFAASVLGLVLALVLVFRPGWPSFEADARSLPKATSSGAISLTQPAFVLPPDLLHGTDGPLLGRANAPVTLEVYSDFQCPVCGRFAKEWMPRLIHDFVSPGQLRVVYHDLAFLGSGKTLDESLEAATGAACAAQAGMFWTYWGYLFANQAGENRGTFGPERLAAIAEASGMGKSAWQACVTGDAARDTVHQATTKAVSLGIRATPTLLVNGRPYEGLIPYDQLAAAIVSAGARSPGSSGR